MSNILHITSLECAGDCGAKIEITVRSGAARGLAHTAAEAIGWATRDHGKKTEVYCPFCVKRAERIVKGS